MQRVRIGITVGDHLATNVHDYGGGPIALEAWHCHWDTGALAPADHDAFAWADGEHRGLLRRLHPYALARP